MTDHVIDIMDGLTLVLVNKERVIYEMIELARLKIAMRLGVPQDKVEAKCNMTPEGKLQVQFSADEKVTEALTSEKVQETIREEYKAAWTRIRERLEGLGAVRGIEEKEKETANV